MSEVISPSVSSVRAPTVGFVSLGCPKALTDSELILTQLSAEGYQTSKTFQGADLVIVNTCGFIDDAVKESLDTIGEALAENGRVIVTGCLGAKSDASGDNMVRKMHPKVLAVTGPHATQEVMDAVHLNLPKPHDPFLDLVPQPFGIAGIKLTPRHYAYLKISEGCNHRCTFCIIPSMRGDLVSRPIGDVLNEARALFEGGVKELLIVSQDTSAYGVDVKYRTGFWDGKPVKTRMLDLVAALGEIAAPYGAWVRLHYVYPYPSVDEIVPLMAEGKVLPYLGERLWKDKSGEVDAGANCINRGADTMHVIGNLCGAPRLPVGELRIIGCECEVKCERVNPRLARCERATYWPNIHIRIVKTDPVKVNAINVVVAHDLFND